MQARTKQPQSRFAVLPFLQPCPSANPSRPESGIPFKGNIYFLCCFMPLPPVRQRQSLRQQGASQFFIGAIFQCPKPLWMLIFYKAKP